MSTLRSTEDAVYHKITWRLLPVLFLSYIFAYLDRVNIGFAKLGMRGEHSYYDEVFYLASGLFFIGYFLFEVPGNILMHKMGARIWITRIMLTWALISGLCAFSSSANMFYWLRFCLGLAEAGFFPAIILYLSFWFPEKRKARVVAMFLVSINFAGIIGSPLSGWIMESTQTSTFLKSWQWLFLIEASPSLLMGICIPFLLTNQPEQAKWLTEEEKLVVKKDIEKDEQYKKENGNNKHQILDAFKSRKVWLFGLVNFFIVIGLYGVSFWLPQIIENTITKDKMQIGFYAAIPWICAAVGMILYGRHSDKTGERRNHIAFACFVGMLAFVASGLHNTNAFFVLLMISLATTALMCASTVFWSLPASILSGAAAATAIAFINSVASLGGFISPEMFDWFKRHYDLGAGLMAAGASLGMAGGIILLVLKK